MLITNHVPKSDSTDKAMIHRKKIIPFDNTFENTKANNDFCVSLEAPEVLDEMFRMFVIAVKEYYARGTIRPLPKAAANATRADTAVNDTVGAFLAEQSQASVVGWRTSDCLRQYQEYCHENHIESVSAKKFASTMKAKNFDNKRKKHRDWDGGEKRHKFYVGIEWKDDNDEEPASKTTSDEE